MITKKELQELYLWGKHTEFPSKKAPTIEGYSNKDIDYYWIKSVKKSTIIRTKFMTDAIEKIYQNDEILFSNYVIFYAGTILRPHKDPDILRHPYKRIQIPLSVPDGDCYMRWTKSGEKILWKEGVTEVCDVCKFVHEAFNNTTKPIEFLFIDVKLDTVVELSHPSDN
tara:strand:+ start:2191 stop:2694 length:504 start_codon:yes stop_codon:yes gene_type:complete